MIYRLYIALAIAVFPLSTHAAQDLLEVLQRAERNDPRYHAARYDLEAALEAVPQARANLLPVLSADARRARIKQDIQERDNIFFGALGESTFHSTSWSLQATQPVFDWGAWVRFGQAKVERKVARATFEEERQQLIRRTAEAYLGVLAAMDSQRLLQAERTAVERQLDLIQGRRRGGLATVTEEYEAQARTARVQADLVAADYGLDDAYQALIEIVGDEIDAIEPFDNEFPLLPPDPLDLQHWLEKARLQNFRLLAARENLEVAQREIRRQRSGHMPSLNLVARNGSTDTGGAVTGGGSDVNTTEIALQFSLPLYSGGRINSQTREARARYNAAREQLDLQTRMVRRETRFAYQTILSATEQIRALSRSLNFQQSGLEGREKGYRAGLNTLLDVLDAQRDLYETRRDFASARYGYVISWLSLKQQIGALSESDLAYFNGFLRN